MAAISRNGSASGEAEQLFKARVPALARSRPTAHSNPAGRRTDRRSTDGQGQRPCSSGFAFHLRCSATGSHPDEGDRVLVALNICLTLVRRHCRPSDRRARTSRSSASYRGIPGSRSIRSRHARGPVPESEVVPGSRISPRRWTSPWVSPSLDPFSSSPSFGRGDSSCLSHRDPMARSASTGRGPASSLVCSPASSAV